MHGYVFLGTCGFIICALLFNLLLGLWFGLLFLDIVDLLTFCFVEWNWQSWFSTFRTSGNCLSIVGINLTHFKYKECIHMLYILLMYKLHSRPHEWGPLCTLLIWTGSMKLISFMQFSLVLLLLNTLLVHLCFGHYRLDVMDHWVLEMIFAWGW